MAARAPRLVFVPTYNESGNVGRLCEEILAADADADVLFIDDDSPDGTGELLDGLAGEHEQVRVLHRSGKLGIGSAHLAGIAYAYEHGYAQLLTMDCDFTHSPAMIPTLFARLESAPVVVGSRYLVAGSIDDWSLGRKSLTVGGHILVKALLGVSEDSTSAFRAYDLGVIPHSIFQGIRSTGYSFFFESLVALKESGAAIAEVPAKLTRRAQGESKMNFTEVRRSIQTLLRLSLLRVSLSRQRREAQSGRK